VVILDEIESLLAHFRSITLSGKGKRPVAFQSLRMYVKTAGKVVAADGHLNTRAVNFLLSCNRKVSVYANCFRTDPNRYLVYEDFEKFFLDAVNYYRFFRMPAVYVSSDNGVAKQLFKKLCQTYPDKRIVLINSEADDFLKSSIVNPEMWKEMDMCIYTATVGVGVDINLNPPHFGRIFGQVSSIHPF
jgi:hypothetical protein